MLLTLYNTRTSLCNYRYIKSQHKYILYHSYPSLTRNAHETNIVVY